LFSLNLASFNHLLSAWLAHIIIIDMFGMTLTEALQEKAEIIIMRCYEAHGRLWLLCKGNTEKNKHQINSPATTAIGD